MFRELGAFVEKAKAPFFEYHFENSGKLVKVLCIGRISTTVFVR